MPWIFILGSILLVKAESGQQQRNAANFTTRTNQLEHLYLLCCNCTTNFQQLHVIFHYCCLQCPSCLANVIKWVNQHGQSG